MKARRLVHVTWIDSAALHGWCDGAVVQNNRPTICESVGWIVRDIKDSIAVSGHWSPDTNEWNGTIVIPRCAVKKVRRLK